MDCRALSWTERAGEGAKWIGSHRLASAAAAIRSRPPALRAVSTSSAPQLPASHEPTQSDRSLQLSRRGLLAAASTLPWLAPLALQSTAAEEFRTLRDDTLAYQFDYPVATTQGRQLPLVFSRRPEKYSSAAPLTADARQRIVCELADLIDAVTVSVTVGPPGGTLRDQEPSQWAPKAVAEQVLIDRSTGRLTSGQRVSLNSVEAVEEREQEGVRYILYEHVSQGSPTISNRSRETYRHALAVTAMRPGIEGTPFLYTLNLSCPNELWDGLEVPFRRAVESFR
ncbi:hypothetical protein N2152v2_002938 [Parachlorella kessleri]